MLHTLLLQCAEGGSGTGTQGQGSQGQGPSYSFVALLARWLAQQMHTYLLNFCYMPCVATNLSEQGEVANFKIRKTLSEVNGT